MYELLRGSKAETEFLREVDISDECVIWHFTLYSDHGTNIEVIMNNSDAAVYHTVNNSLNIVCTADCNAD